MHRRTTEQADWDGGFTLIELLVVMIIIGILASIAIPTFLHQRQNAIGTSQIADLRSVADQIEAFYVSQDQYPDQSTWTQTASQVTMSTAGGTGSQRVTVGNQITYTLNGTATVYCLVAHNPKAAGDRVWVSDIGGIQPDTVTTCPF